MIPTASFPDCSSTEHDGQPESAPSSLRKFKPWVYRPKKVMFSLNCAQPARKQFSTSHWSEAQNRKYIEFLTKFKPVLEGPKKNRRKWHLNRIMSKEVATRSHEQCRSHHQKMIRHYRTVDAIIGHLQKEVNQTTLSEEPHQILHEQRQENIDDFEGDEVSKFLDLSLMDCSVGIQLPFLFDQQDSLDFI